MQLTADGSTLAACMMCQMSWRDFIGSFFSPRVFACLLLRHDKRLLIIICVLQHQALIRLLFIFIDNMTSPVVVQGTAVSSPYGASSQAATQAQASHAPSAATAHHVSNPSNVTKGEKQESKCRDPFFALLLYGNVAAIAALVGVYGVDAFDAEVSDNTDEFKGYLWAVLITGIFSIVFSGMGMLTMMRIPQFLIKTSLIFVVVLTGIWAILAFVSGAIGAGIVGLVFFAIGICYARAVWSRIPFATANLVTACAAIKSNLGVTVIAYIFVLLAFGWSILWTFALMGVWDKTYTCEVVNGQKVCSDPNFGILFGLFISYFFTHEVIQNTGKW
jgi:hypothetical protein